MASKKRKRKKSKRKSSIDLYAAINLLEEQSSYVSDNEFENDQFNSGGHFDADLDEDDIDDDINVLMELYKLKIVSNELQLINTLLNEDILFDSCMTICSSSITMKTYNQIAGILTKNYLYIIPAINYQIWLEFKQRTKIDELINIENKKENDKIDKKMARDLISNLDLSDDDQINRKITPFFIDKTKKEIMLNILLNKNKITNLSAVFFTDCIQLKQSMTDQSININDKSGKFKHIKYIMIQNFFDTNLIGQDFRDSFLDKIFGDIAWIDEDKIKKSIIITLQKYYSLSIMKTLNDNKYTFFGNNAVGETLKILPYYKDRIKYTNLAINLQQFNVLEICKENGINLNCSKRNEQNDGLTFKFDTNNKRCVWMTYLDYAINGRYDYNEQKEKDKCNKDKMVNDFTDSVPHVSRNEIYSRNFSFGKYLNYWEEGYENSVIPIYQSLTNELLNNNIATISKKQYYSLYIECQHLLKLKGYKLRAKYIGVNNKKFNIRKGSNITINHLISLKLYTDFGEIIKEFKKYCRRCDRNESVEDLAKRNSQIAHWCRYVKESCTFWGSKMGKKDVLYTGLNVKLMFTSMKQHFECPLSTTTSLGIAANFCDENGIILKLRAANSKTKYFDVRWLSHFSKEDERLIVGASLKICDIICEKKSLKSYISAIQLLEQIIGGEFIDNSEKTEQYLYSLIVNYMNKDNENIDVDIPQYIIALFKNVIVRIQKQDDFEQRELWINKNELDGIKHKKLRHLLSGEFWKYLGLNMYNMNNVQQFEWEISNELYKQFKNMKSRKYIKSPIYEYAIDKIKFYLRCCSKYSDESNKCALFFHLDSNIFTGTNIESIQIEYNLLCQQTKYKNIMSAQWLSKNKQYCGFQTFSTKVLNKKKSITWKIGIKILQIIHKKSKSYLDLQKERLNKIYCMNDIKNAMKEQDMSQISEICQTLMDQNNYYKTQLFEENINSECSDDNGFDTLHRVSHPRIHKRRSRDIGGSDIDDGIQITTTFLEETEIPQLGRRKTRETCNKVINNSIAYEIKNRQYKKKKKFNKQLTIARPLPVPLSIQQTESKAYDGDSDDDQDNEYKTQQTDSIGVVQRLDTITFDREDEDNILGKYMRNKENLINEYLIPKTLQFKIDTDEKSFLRYIDKMYKLLNRTGIAIGLMIVFLLFQFCFINDIKWSNGLLLGCCCGLLIVLFFVSFYSKNVYIKMVSFVVCIGIVLLYLVISYAIYGDLNTDKFLLYFSIILGICFTVGYILNTAYFVLAFIIFIEYNICVIVRYFDLINMQINETVTMKEILFGNVIIILILIYIGFGIFRMKRQIIFEFINTLQSNIKNNGLGKFGSNNKHGNKYKNIDNNDLSSISALSNISQQKLMNNDKMEHMFMSKLRFDNNENEYSTSPSV
eukprot:143428_1